MHLPREQKESNRLLFLFKKINKPKKRRIITLRVLHVKTHHPLLFVLDEMSGENKGIKRARTQDQQDGTIAAEHLPGREQLLLTSPELQTRLGRKFVDETELLPLMLAYGLIRRVRTILIEVRHLGGDSLMVTLDASKPTVGEAKAAIARSQGTAESRQELFRVAERADGRAVREDDAEPEPLDDESMALKDGDVVAMAVEVSRYNSAAIMICSTMIRVCNAIIFLLSDTCCICYNNTQEPPFLWRTFPADRVTLSEGGALATQTVGSMSLTTTGTEITEGKHYWEVELLSDFPSLLFIGISRPNLDPTGDYYSRECTDGWFISAGEGALWGNGKKNDDYAGGYKQGGRVGVLLDLDNGSLRFFKNGVQHGPGYPAGSVTGPVVAAAQTYFKDASVRLLPNAEAPTNA
jgi:hypothetical protein